MSSDAAGKELRCCGTCASVATASAALSAPVVTGHLVAAPKEVVPTGGSCEAVLGE